MKQKIVLMAGLLAGSVMTGYAQDIGLSQMISNATMRSRTPEGDRTYYGLWAKDKLLELPQLKTKWESAEDSIRKRGEFVTLCGKAFLAYDERDALNTVIYGDSALRTGFDNAQLYFDMAYCYEQLGDYKQAEHSFKMAKKRGFAGGKMALAAFKQRMKERKKTEKNKEKAVMVR